MHWVKVSFVAEATVKVDRHGYTAHAVKGGDPIEDLRDFGVSPAWRGIANLDFSELYRSMPSRLKTGMRIANSTGNTIRP